MKVPSLTGLITTMTTADAMEPIIALEATVVAGRTYQAYRRGGSEEARERFFEEICGSIVWLWGVKVLNELGDSIIGRILKTKHSNFDVGTDKILRTPFNNFMKKIAPKGFTPTHVALMKGAKVASSILIANLVIGFAVPKINHMVTNMFRNQKAEEEKKAQTEGVTFTKESTENLDKNKATSNPNFKGGMAALNSFTNIIENTNTGKLLSTDFGVTGGRVYNARTKEERREIAFRDISSIYFYMWAQGHMMKLLNFAETGKTKRLDPSSAELLNEHLSKFMNKHKDGLSVEEFKKAIFGMKASEVKLPEGIPFETEELSSVTKFFDKFRKTKTEPMQVAKVSDLEKLFSDTEVLTRIREMSKLQPEREGVAVITKAQLIDAINKAEMNDPEFLAKAYKKFTGGNNSEEFKYLSENKLRNFKKLMEQYVESLCKNAKDGKITQEMLDKFKKKNTTMCGINFAAGFAVAALFLSTLIPKMQYYITKKTTGVDAFPGTYEYKETEKKK